MAEAISGLAIASGAICDWRGRGGILDLEGIAVDENGQIFDSSSRGNSTYDGWLPKMMETCYRQLRTAYSENVGMIRSIRNVDEWLQLISTTKGRSLREGEIRLWKISFGRFFSNWNRLEKGINEAAYYLSSHSFFFF
jgi:protein O-GlcNAc transferase